MKESGVMADDIFQDIAREDMVQYMEWLRSAIGELIQSLRRTVALALLLMAIFELVIGSRALKLSVGSFTISSGSVVIVFIPAVISYLYLQVMSDTVELQSRQRTYLDMFYKWSPRGSWARLASWVFSPLPIYWNPGLTYSYSPFNPKFFRRLQYWTKYTFYPGIGVGVLAFEVIAYWQLYDKRVTHGILWATSLCVTVLCSIMAVGYFVMGGARNPVPPEK
jgi:hypothetical protein